MYNLSPRWKKLKSTTPYTLGPNQYYLDTKFVKKNIYPFLSNTTKGSSLSRKLYTDALYNAALQHKIIGGSTINDKALRDCKLPEETPGPAHYYPKYQTRKQKVILKPEDVKGRHLYVCSVPYSLQAVGCSVPTEKDANGYDIDDDKNLIKVPPDEHDRTLGPAYYNIPKIPCLTSYLYQGCKWSKRSALRQVDDQTPGPGPAVYDCSQQKPFNEHDEYVREMARRYAYVPRFLDSQEKRLLRENYPGPAEYNIEPSKKPKCLSLLPIGFLSTSNRFRDNNIELSSPAKYDISKNPVKPAVSKKGCPFNVDTKRFTKKIKMTPGPGQYDVPSPLNEKISKKLGAVPNLVPFNHTAEREMTYIKRELCTVPSPFVYTVERLEMDKGLCDSCVFRSAKLRFPPPRVQKCAEAATYSVSEPFNKNKNRKSHNAGKVPFQSTHPRRETFRPSGFYNPGPANYVQHKPVDPKGYYFKQSPRFPRPTDTPGPGTYWIHPSYEVSIYKAIGTSNLRLKENVLRSKLKTAPCETHEAWKKEIKKQKKLKAFYKKPSRIGSWLTLL